MKLINKTNEYRRDFTGEYKCESCGKEHTERGGYDDRNYYDNVIPNLKCPRCNETTLSLGLEPEYIETKYPAGAII